MWRCDNVGGLGEHVTCHMFWFLRWTFFIHVIALRRDRWMDLHDLHVLRRVSAQGCAFWGPVFTAAHLVSQKFPKPQFRAYE